MTAHTMNDRRRMYLTLEIGDIDGRCFLDVLRGIVDPIEELYGDVSWVVRNELDAGEVSG